MSPKGSDASNAPETAGRRRPVAVIDVGSNSVRLVVYSGETRTPIPLHNEKAICALGKGLERTGFLNSQGITLAFDTVARFVSIARRWRLAHRCPCHGCRTDAKDGEAFAKAIEKRCDIRVQIPTGKQEARCPPRGCCAGFRRGRHCRSTSAEEVSSWSRSVAAV